VRRLEHRWIRIVGVSVGYDTASGEGRKIGDRREVHLWPEIGERDNACGLCQPTERCPSILCRSGTCLLRRDDECAFVPCLSGHPCNRIEERLIVDRLAQEELGTHLARQVTCLVLVL